MVKPWSSYLTLFKWGLILPWMVHNSLWPSVHNLINILLAIITMLGVVITRKLLVAWLWRRELLTWSVFIRLTNGFWSPFPCLLHLFLLNTTSTTATATTTATANTKIMKICLKSPQGELFFKMILQRRPFSKADIWRNGTCKKINQSPRQYTAAS